MEAFYGEHLKQNNINENGMSKHQRYLWFCNHCNNAGFSHHSRARNHLWKKHQINYHFGKAKTDSLQHYNQKIALFEKNINNEVLQLERMLSNAKEDYEVLKEVNEKIKSICQGLMTPPPAEAGGFQ
jgi:hypothetical protein